MYEIVQENTLKIEQTKKQTIAYNRVSSRSQVYDLIVDDWKPFLGLRWFSGWSGPTNVSTFCYITSLRITALG